MLPTLWAFHWYRLSAPQPGDALVMDTAPQAAKLRSPLETTRPLLQLLKPWSHVHPRKYLIIRRGWGSNSVSKDLVPRYYWSNERMGVLCFVFILLTLNTSFRKTKPIASISFTLKWPHLDICLMISSASVKFYRPVHTIFLKKLSSTQPFMVTKLRFCQSTPEHVDKCLKRNCIGLSSYLIFQALFLNITIYSLFYMHIFKLRLINQQGVSILFNKSVGW